MIKTCTLLLAASLAWSADAVADAQAAMASNDATAKKSALRALGSKGAGDDAAAISLLIGALSDRQGGEAAVNALKSRTGASPKGGTWIPGKEADTIEAWQGWYAAEQQKKKVADLQKKADAPAKKKPVVEQNTEDVPQPEAKPAKVVVLPEDLGRLDRIILKAGGSMLCYIQSRRTDADGNLVSLRIVHPENGGEEILPAALVSRVDEDIR